MPSSSIAKNINNPSTAQAQREVSTEAAAQAESKTQLQTTGTIKDHQHEPAWEVAETSSNCVLAE